MESWRLVWRKGFAPLLPLAGLTALAKALREDDERLVQGSTTTPPPLLCVHDWPVEAADAIGFVGWQAGAKTVGEVEEFFARACYDADERLNEMAACRWFLLWYDDTPRAEVFRELLAEVESELTRRTAADPATVPDGKYVAPGDAPMNPAGLPKPDLNGPGYAGGASTF